MHHSNHRFVGSLLIGLIALIVIITGCSALPGQPAAQDPAASLQNMQGMMAAMQGMMSAAEASPPGPEMMQNMQSMMGSMQGMMQGMSGLDDAERQATMAQMQSMMGNMQNMPMQNMEGMAMPTDMAGMMESMGAAPVVPAGMAYVDGQEIRFMHTEVSDPDIAKLLSDMMSSPVVYVPSLAQAPADMVAPVYVFTNGLEGMGPLGFQPDVFDNPPGSDGYTPLRAIHLVTWADPANARELKAAADVLAAQESGEVTIETPGVVVNMPFVTWPGGER